MSDYPIGLYNSSMSEDSSMVRLRVSSDPNSSHIVTKSSTFEIIHITDNSDLEILSIIVMHKGTTFSDSSFEALLSDEDAENDHVVTSMHVFSQAT